MQDNVEKPGQEERTDISGYFYDAQVSEDVKAHLSRYYAAVDTSGSHEEYARAFTEDAVLTLPTGSQVRGRDGKLGSIFRWDW